MPQLDIQTPSEDEDFDATSQAVPDTSLEPDSSQETSVQATGDNHTGDVADSEALEGHEGQQLAETEPVKDEAADKSAETYKPTAGRPDFSDIRPAVTAPVPASLDRKNDGHTPVPPHPSQTSPVSPKAKRFSWHYVIEALLVVIIVVLALFVWSLNSDRHDLAKEVSSLNANPQAVVQKQTQSLITAVGKLMQLPQGETPTVASVSNAAAAKKQSAFFDNAQNGDKVLLYVKSGEAILYRPSTNKIILVAPLTLSGSGTSTPAGTTSTSTTTTNTSSTTDK